MSKSESAPRSRASEHSTTQQSLADFRRKDPEKPTMILPKIEPDAGPWSAVPLTDVVTTIAEHAGDRRPVVIAVDGRSGSGKTTLASRLRALISDCVVVHTDDVAWHESFFDWDYLMVSGILNPLRRGEPVRFRPPAWDRMGRTGAIEVPASTHTVVVEGVGCGRDSLSPWIDFLIWVQSDQIEARRRGVERDGGDSVAVEFWEEWAAEEGRFLEAERPWERAGLVVCGTPSPTGAPDHPSTHVLLGAAGAGERITIGPILTKTDHTIRPATAGDLQRIKQIAIAAGMFSASEVEFFGEMLGGSLDGSLEGHQWLVTETVEASLTGAAQFAPEPVADRMWNIYFIAVDPSCQGTGLGTALMRHIESDLVERGGDHARTLIVETSSTDQYAQARDFYRGLGYDEEATVRDYYGPGDDKVTFWKSLVASDGPTA